MMRAPPSVVSRTRLGPRLRGGVLGLGLGLGPGRGLCARERREEVELVGLRESLINNNIMVRIKCVHPALFPPAVANRLLFSKVCVPR